jgi:hypothetical protein
VGEAKPGFLHGVFCLALRAEHPVGDRAQMSAVGLEALRQNFFFAHRHIPLAQSVMGMTNDVKLV